MRRFLLATLLMSGVAVSANAAELRHNPAPKHWNGVSVPLDEVRMISFTQPVSTLYVGNPVIADVTMIDKRHAFVQGKAFGTTNILALDGNGHEISNRTVVVAGGGAAVVTLQRGPAQTTYACASSRCETTPLPGDGKETYDSNMDQITKHQEMLAKAATSDGR